MIPYICSQPFISNPGLVYKMRFVNHPSLPNLQILSESTKLFKKPFNMTTEEMVVDALLGGGEHLTGTLPTGHSGLLLINMASNMISVETKRGLGNVLVLHPDDYDDLLSPVEKYVLIMYEVFKEPIDFLKGKVIVLYRGSGGFDGSPILAYNDKNEFAIAATDMIENYVKILHR